MLEVEKIQAGYGSVQVLWGVSMKINEGEFIALIGPNGAGKTTSLKTISGLINPLSGKIRFLGKDIVGIPLHERAKMGISFVPEDMSLFTGMSIRENLILGAFSVQDKKQVKESLDTMFELFPKLEERHGPVHLIG